jgi:hypothetical protein
LLEASPAFVETFGQPSYDSDDDRYWRWWVFAVFDGTRWEMFHLDDHFDLSLESGSLSDEDAHRPQRVAEMIYGEFQRAVESAPWQAR